MYNNKEAKCPMLPLEVNKEIEVSGSTVGSDGESTGGDNEDSESSLAGSQGVPGEHIYH